MTLLVRDPATSDYSGLSMLIAPKIRGGTEENPFPTPGMTGGEIEVLGYRGMKEYELGFDGFKVPGGNLLGDDPGQGFQAADADVRVARIEPPPGPSAWRNARWSWAALRPGSSASR